MKLFLFIFSLGSAIVDAQLLKDDSPGAGRNGMLRGRSALPDESSSDAMNGAVSSKQQQQQQQDRALSEGYFHHTIDASTHAAYASGTADILFTGDEARDMARSSVKIDTVLLGAPAMGGKDGGMTHEEAVYFQYAVASAFNAVAEAESDDMVRTMMDDMSVTDSGVLSIADVLVAGGRHSMEGQDDEIDEAIGDDIVDEDDTTDDDTTDDDTTDDDTTDDEDFDEQRRGLSETFSLDDYIFNMNFRVSVSYYAGLPVDDGKDYLTHGVLDNDYMTAQELGLTTRPTLTPMPTLTPTRPPTPAPTRAPTRAPTPNPTRVSGPTLAPSPKPTYNQADLNKEYVDAGGDWSHKAESGWCGLTCYTGRHHDRKLNKDGGDVGSKNDDAGIDAGVDAGALPDVSSARAGTADDVRTDRKAAESVMLFQSFALESLFEEELCRLLHMSYLKSFQAVETCIVVVYG